MTTASVDTTLTIDTVPVTVPDQHERLEAAARLLIETLPRHIADYVYEVAYVSNRQPAWTVVAGHLLRAYENGEMTAPLLDPSWGRSFGTVGLDLSATRCKCEWPPCSAVFTPKRFRQRFCSNACGAASNAAGAAA